MAEAATNYDPQFDELLLAQRLREEKNEKKTEWQTGRAFLAVARKRSAGEAIKQGIALGSNLRSQISDTKFEGSTFYTVLLLSVVKDLLDILTVGTIGALANFVITPALIMIFFMKRPILKRLLIRFFLGSIILEGIFGIAIFPAYTISTFMLKHNANKKIKELNSRVKEVEKEIAKIK